MKDYRLLWTSLARFLLGCLAGLAASLAVMAIVVGIGPTVDSLSLYFRTFASFGGGYSLGSMVSLLVRQAGEAWHNLTHSPLVTLRYIHLLGMASFVLSTVTAIVIRKKRPGDSALLALTAAIVFLLSFGSNTGMNLYAILAAPLLAGLAVSLKYLILYIPGIRPARTALLTGCALFMLANCVLFGLRLYNNNYLDGLTGELTAAVDIPELAGMKTTPERAGDMKLAYDLLHRPELKGRELLIMGSFPMGYILADNPKFIPEHWGAWADLSSVNIKRLTAVIADKEARGILPAIFISYLEVNDQANRVTLRAPKKVEAVLAFAQRNGYTLVYQDADFELRLPPAGK